MMKTGIVLEGGALRTIFSSGVTDGLLRGGVDFDYVVGVSAGIAYGVSYLSKQFGRNLEILTKYANDKRYMGKRNLFLPGNRCYFGLRFTYDDIPNRLVPFDYETFAAWPGQAEAVVTNVETGQAEYLEVPRRDDKFLLLQATCAMPLLFPIYDLDGIRCLDGGAADAGRRKSSSPSSTCATGATPPSARPCAAGPRPTTPPGRSSSGWSGRGRSSCWPRRAPRASPASRRMWTRSAPCGSRAMTRPWTAWRRSGPSCSDHKKTFLSHDS